MEYTPLIPRGGYRVGLITDEPTWCADQFSHQESISQRSENVSIAVVTNLWRIRPVGPFLNSNRKSYQAFLKDFQLYFLLRMILINFHHNNYDVHLTYHFKETKLDIKNCEDYHDACILNYTIFPK